MIKFLAVGFVLISLASCATIEHQNVLRQKINQPLEAGIGDVVISIK